MRPRRWTKNKFPSLKSDSRLLTSLRKDLLNHSTPFVQSKWMPSQEHSSGKNFLVKFATSSNLRGRILFIWTSCITIDVTHSFIHAYPILVLYHIVRHCADRKFRSIEVDPRLLQRQYTFSGNFVIFLDSPLETSILPITVVTICILLNSSISSGAKI